MPKKLHQVIGQRSRIKHHGITHVDNIYWIRGVERRMSSVPKGKGRRKFRVQEGVPKGRYYADCKDDPRQKRFTGPLMWK